jgi:membrane protein
MVGHRSYLFMSLTERPLIPENKGNLTLLSALALIGTYALTLALQRRQRVIAAGRTALPFVRPAGRQERHWSRQRWQRVLYRTYNEINDDRLLALAAGVVFYGLLALFPAITALVSSYALFAAPATISGHLAAIAGVMPASAYTIVDEQVSRIVSHAAGTLGVTFFTGLAIALWSANAGIKAVIDALNIVYGVKERRSFLVLNAVSLAFTAGVIVVMLAAIWAVVVLPVAFAHLPFGARAEAWSRWPALFVLLLAGLAVLYRFGPSNPYARWQWISPGALFAAVAFLGGSALLSWYLASFANYDATYGSLGAAIGLMMWLWMTAIVVLVGAEFNSEIDAEAGLLPPTEQKLG